MSARTLKRIFLVGFADLAYRVFLRGFVRRQVGMEAGLIRAGLDVGIGLPAGAGGGTRGDRVRSGR